MFMVLSGVQSAVLVVLVEVELVSSGVVWMETASNISWRTFVVGGHRCQLYLKLLEFSYFVLFTLN